jgi:outer membrane protein assembly factor BamB
VVFDKDYNPLRIFVLDNFFPDILEMSTMQPVGNILYFDCNYNGYASILEKKTGYLVAMDLTTGDVLWASKNLTASAWHFLVLDDTLVAGYGFTDEPDFLYLLNRHDGSLLQTVKLKSAHSFLIARGNRLYVRTYDTDYVFDIKR